MGEHGPEDVVEAQAHRTRISGSQGAHGQAVEALTRFADDVRSGAFPSRDESYRMPRSTADALRKRSAGAREA